MLKFVRKAEMDNNRYMTEQVRKAEVDLNSGIGIGRRVEVCLSRSLSDGL